MHVFFENQFFWKNRTSSIVFTNKLLTLYVCLQRHLQCVYKLDCYFECFFCCDSTTRVFNVRIQHVTRFETLSVFLEKTESHSLFTCIFLHIIKLCTLVCLNWCYFECLKLMMITLYVFITMVSLLRMFEGTLYTYII